MPHGYVVDLPSYRAMEPRRAGIGDLLAWNLEGAYSSIANAGFLFLAGVVLGAYMFSGKKR